MVNINAFDFDGVVSLGITPGKNDIIITGRCYDEAHIIYKELNKRGIKNAVFFNPISYDVRGDHTASARIYSGEHKARTLKQLQKNCTNVLCFFEDDPLQAKIIKESGWGGNVVLVCSDLVEK